MLASFRLLRKKKLSRSGQSQMKHGTGQRQAKEFASIAAALLLKHACPFSRKQTDAETFWVLVKPFHTKNACDGCGAEEGRV